MINEIDRMRLTEMAKPYSDIPSAVFARVLLELCRGMGQLPAVVSSADQSSAPEPARPARPAWTIGINTPVVEAVSRAGSTHTGGAVGEALDDIAAEMQRRAERTSAGAANEYMTWPHPTEPGRYLYHFLCKVLGCTPAQYMKYDPERKVVDIDKDPGHLKIIVNLLDLMAIPGSGWEYLNYAHRSPEALAVKAARKKVQDCQQEIHLMGTGLVVQSQVDALQAAVTEMKAAESKMLPYSPLAPQA